MTETERLKELVRLHHEREGVLVEMNRLLIRALSGRKVRVKHGRRLTKADKAILREMGVRT